MRWVRGAEGVVDIGHAGDGFAFDCEGPRFSALLTPHALASRPVTNGEWRAFIADGGYRTASLWLSDGWAWVQAEGIDAPRYWDGRSEERRVGKACVRRVDLGGHRILQKPNSIIHDLIMHNNEHIRPPNMNPAQLL